MRTTAICIAMVLTTVRLHAAEPKTVEAEGRAPAEAPHAREMALTDALRAAVSAGVGVDVISDTRVRDFTLDYDRVFASSFGHVRNYTVIKTGVGADGIYRVTIRAEVGPGEPNMRDELAIRQIIRLKQSPRVALEVEELIEGVPAGSDCAKAWFEQVARDMQLQLVDTARAARQHDRLAVRDETNGDQAGARLRGAHIAQEADFIVQAKVRAHYVGKAPYGMIGHVFSVAVDLRALRPDSAAVLASVALPPREIVSDQESQPGAARDAIQRVLGGSGNADAQNGMTLFRRILAAWVTELDLGTVVRLELRRLEDSAHDRLLDALRRNERITSVWPREFDSKGLSYVDVESRLESGDLKAAVVQALQGQFRFEAGTMHYLQFSRTPETRPVAATNSPSASLPGQEASSAPSPSLPPWAWALIGAGAILILMGVYRAGADRRK